MVSRRNQCDTDRLKRSLDGQLPEQNQAEVEQHLETCETCRRDLESLAAEPSWWNEVPELLRGETTDQAPTTRYVSDPKRRGSVWSPQFASGRPVSLEFLAPAQHPENLGRLGPYEIVELIGSGGMGVVLKGFDANLHRYVAIKVLAPQLACSAASRQRFAREARAAAAVNHEHVVAIHAVDEAQGLPYLVMPLIAGESLQQRIDRTGPLGVKEILRIAVQTASGLAAAHAQGLVHRDIKPANILLENGVERVLITDFGLARAVDDASLTCSGVVAGTPQYMAPEQANGEAVDHRTDLFSLGSVMYAMCTGHSPFRAETTMAVLRRICEGTPRPIRQVNAEIPDWLEAIVGRLHRKNPAERFQTADEVARLLGQYLAHVQHPTALPMPPWPAGCRWPRARRRRWWAAGVGAAVLLAIVGLVTAEWSGASRLTGWRAGQSLQAEPDRPSQSLPHADEPQARVATVRPQRPAGSQIGPSFSQQVAEIRGQLEQILAGLRQPGAEPAPSGAPDPLALLRMRIEELHRRVQVGPQPDAADLLVALEQELDQLEQAVRARYQAEPADPIPGIAERLDRLERELADDSL